MYNNPEKSYIIEPHEGEINYNIVFKNPNKFYDQVFNQDVTKMTCKRQESLSQESSPKKKQLPLQIKSRVTKRPHLKLMAKLKLKILQMIKAKCHINIPDENLVNVMSTSGIDQQIKLLINENKLHMVDKNNKEVYVKELRRASQMVTKQDDL